MPRRPRPGPSRTDMRVTPLGNRTGQLPALTVLAVAGAGLLLAAVVDWQLGAVVLGLSLLLAAGLRLTLPPPSAGALVVRTRGLDAALMLAVGFALLVLATTIPPA